MRKRFQFHHNTSVFNMMDHEFLAYAARDALVVLLAGCFMGPDKAGRGQAASLSGQVAIAKHQKRKRAGPPSTELLKELDWEHTRAKPVYSTARPDDDEWYTTIDFDILAK